MLNYKLLQSLSKIINGNIEAPLLTSSFELFRMQGLSMSINGKSEPTLTKVGSDFVKTLFHQCSKVRNASQLFAKVGSHFEKLTILGFLK